MPSSSKHGAHISEPHASMLQGIAFYIFSAVMIASALMVIAARNPVHSVLFLILAFFNAAALFVVMMLDIDFVALRRGFMEYLPLGALIGLVLMSELLIVLGAWVFGRSVPAAPLVPSGLSNTRALGQILYTDYIFYFQTAGLILLVAMIGAIVLTLRRRPGVKRQSISRQLGRQPAH